MPKLNRKGHKLDRMTLWSRTALAASQRRADRISELIAAGRSLKQIAFSLGCSPSHVRWIAREFGISIPGEQRNHMPAALIGREARILAHSERVQAELERLSQIAQITGEDPFEMGVELTLKELVQLEKDSVP